MNDTFAFRTEWETVLDLQRWDALTGEAMEEVAATVEGEATADVGAMAEVGPTGEAGAMEEVVVTEVEVDMEEVAATEGVEVTKEVGEDMEEEEGRTEEVIDI